jgi:micrococcal nuclease
MKKKIIFLTILSFTLTACTSTGQQAGSGSGVVDAYKKAQQIQKVAEERKSVVEKVVEDDIVEKEAQTEKPIKSEDLTVEAEATSTLSEPEIKDEEPKNEYYSVVKVVDGDTIDVDINGQTERIRFIGLNTPETVDPRKPVECFGQEASKKMSEMLAGQAVRLEVDSTQGNRDKYNRLLRYIYLKDGTDIVLKMIKEGYGYEYAYELPYQNQKQYDEAEIYARENEQGLWAPGVCVEEEEDAKPEPIPTLDEPKITEVSGPAEFKIIYIFYDGEEGRSEPDEYVEIKNTGRSANLKGYTLSDESNKIYTFKDINLDANQSVKVYTGCGDDTDTSLYWCFNSSAIWNNSGDTATLKDLSGGVIDTYSYKK